jgi:hypothetical protein
MRSLPGILSIGFLQLFLISSSRAEDIGNGSFTAAQLLDRMSSAYAKYKTYQDSGTVKTTFFETLGNRVAEADFMTTFVRPDRFRFEFSEKNTNGRLTRYTVSQNGSMRSALMIASWNRRTAYGSRGNT